MTDEEIKALLRFEGLGFEINEFSNGRYTTPETVSDPSHRCCIFSSPAWVIAYGPTESYVLQEAWKKYNKRRNQSKT